MSAAITIDGFDARFTHDPDPWNTFTARDEAIKRAAILRGVGRVRGRVLELACGNGSNSVALQDRALRLVATDGAPAALELTRKALERSRKERFRKERTCNGRDRAQVRLARLPDQLPRGPFHACVIAEVLYYLTPRQIDRLAERLVNELAYNATLVLAHHHVDFDDTASPPATAHERLMSVLGNRVTSPAQTIARTRFWRVDRVRVT